jgi:hypothetical protein
VDNWEHLLAIADLAGGDWPQRSGDAAVALSGNGQDADDSLGVMLLADVRVQFIESNLDRSFVKSRL